MFTIIKHYCILLKCASVGKCHAFYTKIFKATQKINNIKSVPKGIVLVDICACIHIFLYWDKFMRNCIFVSWSNFNTLRFEGKQNNSTYLAGECVVAKGTILVIRSTSRIVASVVGKYETSSIDGMRFRPMTASSSSWHRFRHSGFRSMKTCIHIRVVLMVSIPAENRSEITCIICSSVSVLKIEERKYFIYYFVFIVCAFFFFFFFV